MQTRGEVKVQKSEKADSFIDSPILENLYKCNSIMQAMYVEFENLTETLLR